MSCRIFFAVSNVYAPTAFTRWYLVRLRCFFADAKLGLQMQHRLTVMTALCGVRHILQTHGVMYEYWQIGDYSLRNVKSDLYEAR